jgi:hypothetical protein
MDKNTLQKSVFQDEIKGMKTHEKSYNDIYTCSTWRAAERGENEEGKIGNKWNSISRGHTIFR